MRVLPVFPVVVVCCLALAPNGAAAQALELPRSLASNALSDLRPASFTPSSLGSEDYTLRRLDREPSPAAALARVELVPGSLDWVRVADVMLVPRGVIRVSVPGARAGQVRHAGFVHALIVKDGVARAEVPIALLSTPEATIEVESERDGFSRIERYLPVLAPRPDRRGVVMLDSSCSPMGVRVMHGAIPDDAWLYLGCRQIRSVQGDRASATLELYALWSGDGALEVDGSPTAPLKETLYTLRVTSDPGFVTLRMRGHELVLGYTAPPHLPSAFLGVGVGPYAYRYREGDTDVQAWLPLVTLYGGYAFSPDVRVVYFNASVPDAHGSIDQGLYLWLEQARFVDERMSFILLLGGNVLIYAHDDRAAVRFSIPQGFELAFRDLFARGRNLTVGAFLYPELKGRSYYNVWLRWGSPQLFGELNYIEWQEPHGRERTRSRAAGVSFGTPLFRFM